MIHVVFIMPYMEIQDEVNAAFQLLKNRNRVRYEIIAERPGEEELLSLRCDMVISRGLMAQDLANLQVPNLEMNTTGYDLIRALKSCVKEHGKKRMLLIGSTSMVYAIQNINELFDDMEIECQIARNREDLRRKVRVAARREEIGAVIGGRLACETAREENKPCTMIQVGRESICQAVEDAVRLVDVTRRERAERDEMKKIMDYSFEGIISTDPDGFITSMNKSACSLLGVEESRGLGSLASGLIPGLVLDDVITYGTKTLGEMARVGQNMLIYNCVPIQGGERNTGAIITCQSASDIQKQEAKIRKKLYNKGFVARYRFQGIVYRDEMMHGVVKLARRYAKSDSNILIQGETGTGKEMFAQSIHNESARRSGPFVAINCAALPEQLLESELFGYTEGAFTGASKTGKMGLFEAAHRGTVFLDEIGDLSAMLQGRLLRVLQEREIVRLGDDHVTPIDVRVLSATNKNLWEEIGRGNFRSDLLYRLNVLHLELPPLRERRGDILPLIQHFIAVDAPAAHSPLAGFTEQACELLTNHSWLGNVREIRNFSQRICVMCDRERADTEDVLGALEQNETALPQPDPHLVERQLLRQDLSLDKAELERQEIISALRQTSYKRNEAARLLRMDRSTLWRKIRKHNIPML